MQRHRFAGNTKRMQTKETGPFKKSEKQQGARAKAPKVGGVEPGSPPAPWAQDPTPCRAAAGPKELHTHPRLVISSDMSNEGQAFEET